MKKNYIIIGSSAAGLSAAHKIREIDPLGSITCVTADPEMPYNRCLLADYISGHRGHEAITLKNRAFFDEKKISLVLSARVTEIDREQQHVLLENGTVLAYDKLFIGSGRSSWMPDLPGTNLQGVFPFYGLHETNNILAFVKNHSVKNAVVVGAGLSGLECADALAQLGLQVNVIERAHHALPNQLNHDGGKFLASLMHKRQVTLHASNQINEITGTSNFVAGAKLADGTTLPAQMVVFAIGGKVNSDFAQSAGLSMFGHGIVVDEFMQTSDHNIFAGGDVCAVPDLLTGHLVQSCLWADAAQQGMAAGSSMAGVERKYLGSLIVSSSHIYGTTFVTCGPVTNPPAHLKQHVRQGPDFYHVYLTDGNQLKGFAMIGKVDNVGLLRKKLLDKTEFVVPGT